MSAGSLYIVLGCYGRTDDGFVSCGAVENSILEVGDNLHDPDAVMDYLDSVGLFDRQLLDYNVIRHFIHNLYKKFDQPTRKLWSEKQFNLYQKFVIDHRNCGLFIRLDISAISNT